MFSRFPPDTTSSTVLASLVLPANIRSILPILSKDQVVLVCGWNDHERDGNHGQSWAIMGNYGRFGAIVGNYVRSWAIMGDFGQLWEILLR